jgi:hypothetical protein
MRDKLTARQVQTLKHGKHADGGGLYLFCLRPRLQAMDVPLHDPGSGEGNEPRPQGPQSSDIGGTLLKSTMCTT